MNVRLLLAILSLAFAASVQAAETAKSQPGAPQAKVQPPRRFTDLKSGVYDCKLTGMLCTSCADIITQEVSRIDGVEKAKVDFELAALRVTIAPRKVVRVDAIKRALARSARRIDLGTRFVIGEIKYVP